MRNEAQVKAVALFMATAHQRDFDLADQQDIVRAYAHKSHLQILAFVAMRKASPERLIQAFHLCKSYGAQKLIVDDMKTLFMTAADTASFIDFLSADHIDLIDASTSATFHAAHLASLKVLLWTCGRALKADRGRSIKKALRLKKRGGAKLGARKYGESHLEAQIVKQVVELNEAGLSLQKICDVLIATDIPSVRHKKWHPTTIKRIIDRHNG